MRNNMKKYKLIYTNPVDYSGDQNEFSSKHTFYMLYKRVLWWYFPLYIKQTQEIPYMAQMDIFNKIMHTSNKNELLQFFDEGFLKFESFTSNRPVYYWMQKDKDLLNEEYFDSKNELMSKFGECYV